jgi:Glucose / Sorbosone dehydrogenase
MVIERLKFLLLLFLLPLTVTCGGGGGGGRDSVVGGGATTTGSLTLTVDGLPGGVDGAVSVSGPAGFAQSVKATQTLTNLAPGTYTVSAAHVIDGPNTYTPLSISQNVTVGAGSTAVGAVAYTAQPAFALALRQVAGGLTSALFLTAPANDARLFIVEQPGRIRIVKNGALLGAPFLNIAPSVSSSGERGLLSVVFDPHYTTNGCFYVY